MKENYIIKIFLWCIGLTILISISLSILHNIYNIETIINIIILLSILSLNILLIFLLKQLIKIFNDTEYISQKELNDLSNNTKNSIFDSMIELKKVDNYYGYKINNNIDNDNDIKHYNDKKQNNFFIELSRLDNV